MFSLELRTGCGRLYTSHSLSYKETSGSQLPPGDVWSISGDLLVVTTGGAPGI